MIHIGLLERNVLPKASSTRHLVVLILLLQVISAVKMSLILRSGDIEENPGPGLHPGEMCS